MVSFTDESGFEVCFKMKPLLNGVGGSSVLIQFHHTDLSVSTAESISAETLHHMNLSKLHLPDLNFSGCTQVEGLDEVYFHFSISAIIHSRCIFSPSSQLPALQVLGFWKQLPRETTSGAAASHWALPNQPSLTP